MLQDLFLNLLGSLKNGGNKSLGMKTSPSHGSDIFRATSIASVFVQRVSIDYQY
jgi:hypothetical protein